MHAICMQLHSMHGYYRMLYTGRGQDWSNYDVTCKLPHMFITKHLIIGLQIIARNQETTLLLLLLLLLILLLLFMRVCLRIDVPCVLA